MAWDFNQDFGKPLREVLDKERQAGLIRRIKADEDALTKEERQELLGLFEKYGVPMEDWGTVCDHLFGGWRKTQPNRPQQRLQRRLSL